MELGMEQNGQGTTIYPDGNKYVGEYKDGKHWKGTVNEKNGKLLGKYVNGEYIKQ